ncbi:hypothetical protein VCSRO127_0510 [Vibrio cholerae]|nr:hypothetical protein VCSRO127_0510 [Vibrio cholerae]
MRYRRINLDGKSVTETRLAAANTLPGVLVIIDSSEEFAVVSALSGRIYVMHPASHQGLGISEAVPAGDSGVAEYVEEGRELALLCPAGAYKKDTPIKLGTAGKGAIGVEGTDVIIGYSQDEVTLTADDLIRVRFRSGVAVTA